MQPLTLNDRLAPVAAALRRGDVAPMLEQRSVPTDAAGPFAFLGYGATGISGVHVNEASALSLSAVWGCVRVVSELAGHLPLGIFEELAAGGKRKATDHPVYRLLHLEPNAYQSAITFREQLVAHALLWGNFYARIERDGRFRPIALHPIHPRHVEIIDRRKAEGKVYFRVCDPDGFTGTLQDYEMLHVPILALDGLCGRSVIQHHRENLGLTLATQKSATSFYENGAHVDFTLSTDKPLKKETVESLRNQFSERYSGIGNTNKPLLLQDGLKAERIGLPAGDRQYLETRKFQTVEICRMFRVPPHLVYDLERATNNNIEHQSMEFVTYSLMPLLVRIEQAMRLRLLRDAEKATYVVKFNVNALMRGDTAARALFYGQMRQNGLMNGDDIRALEDLGPMPGGEHYLVNGNMISVDTAAAQQPRTNTPPTTDKQPAA